jgi:transcriptional regulator with XRE-family HTH domain
VGERREPQGPLGTAIRLIREEKRLSKASVAVRGGISERWLLDVEAGRSNPTWANIRRIAKGLKVTLAELMDQVEKCEEEVGNRGQDG